MARDVCNLDSVNSKKQASEEDEKAINRHMSFFSYLNILTSYYVDRDNLSLKTAS